MKKIFLILFLQFSSLFSFAQTTEDSLKTVIGKFFEGMQKSDTASLKKILHEDAFLFSITNKKTGIHRDQESVDDFLKTISEPLPEKWEERILNYTFLIDEMMCSVWTEYDFYYDGKLMHTGVNQFTLTKSKESKEWIIVSIMDTRYPGGKGDIQNKNKTNIQIKIIDSLMNDWHIGAAKANEKSFFAFMSDSCIYKGTDKTERWKKVEFLKFAKPHFDKGKAWDFKPLERNIRMDEQLQTAWFDERLDTWMGECKATGILKKENGEWKLWLYDLSVTIDNDKIKSFIELSSK